MPFDLLLCDEAHRMAEAARSSATRSSSLEEWQRLLGSRTVTSLAATVGKLGVDVEGATEGVVACRREAEAFFGRVRIQWGEGRTLRTPQEGKAVEPQSLLAEAEKAEEKESPESVQKPSDSAETKKTDGKQKENVEKKDEIKKEPCEGLFFINR